jgi:ABC-type bacteriocin/lantibiotic exporter with double-glycine peptidase domain
VIQHLTGAIFTSATGLACMNLSANCLPVIKPLSGTGINLSVGQKQRIARALAKDPSILI